MTKSTKELINKINAHSEEITKIKFNKSDKYININNLLSNKDSLYKMVDKNEFKMLSGTNIKKDINTLKYSLSN